MTRSIYTTITTLLAIIMLLILGVSSIRNFALPLLIGIALLFLCDRKLWGWLFIAVGFVIILAAVIMTTVSYGLIGGLVG